MQKINLTIIIPTYNCGQFLKTTLIHLSKQTRRNFEVLIIDDRSNDQTEKIARTFSSKLNLIFIKKKKQMNKGAAASINFAFSKIKTKYWALLDSDAFLKPNWVHAVTNLLENSSSNNVVGAPILASKEGGLIAYLIGLEIESRYEKLNEGHLQHLSTCNIAGKIDVIKYIKLNEDLNYAYDHELSFQLNQNQIFFYLTKKTNCEHVNKSGWFNYFLQQYKIAKYHSFLSKKMPKRAIRGDEISPIYLLLQPTSLIISLVFILINYYISIIFILFLLLMNWKFISISIKRNFLYIFPVIISIFIKNIAWIIGAIVGTIKQNI
jgi:glycosyltransferase involved in cell wall biosynthesis